MNWRMWHRIETVLRERSIRPIMAVVPDNQDKRLACEEANPDFWNHVREWQQMGWTIALHGYQHVYATGNAGMLGITAQSEFAGLPRDVQEAKLRAGLAVFRAEGISTDTWVAPSHSFDSATLDLLVQMEFRIISDGFATRHFVDDRGLVWIPCQQWDRFGDESKGVYTVCYHHNSWTQERFAAFCRDIEEHGSQVIGVAELLDNAEVLPLGYAERLEAWSRGIWKYRLRRAVKTMVGRLPSSRYRERVK